MSRRIALIVGISQYNNHLNNLVAPIKDAERVAKLLKEYGAFNSVYPLENIRKSGIISSQVLWQQLENLFNPSLSEEVELALFYFSGHGVKHQGQTVYLAASDNPYAVAIHTLLKLVQNSSVQNIAIWLDCCHSGEILEFTALDAKGCCVVAASTANEEALGTKKHGFLTDLLCQALEPTPEQAVIQSKDLINRLEQLCKNLPQQVLQRGNKAFTLTTLPENYVKPAPYPIEHRPYKGLEAFSFSHTDKDFFFGREGFIQQLHDRLKNNTLTAVLGASGSGKSSLVLAGLLPELNAMQWQIFIIQPHTQPLNSLRDAFVRAFPTEHIPPLQTAEHLIQVIQHFIPSGQQLLLVIDQFEEVFTQCKSETERNAWFTMLLGTAKHINALHIMLTLRADFLGQCTDYPELGQTIHHNTLLLTAPHTHELRNIINYPLYQVGMTIEAKLTDELIAESLNEKGSLPLLQYVLDKLWQRARAHSQSQLTWENYNELGGSQGLRGILNQKADAFLASLPNEQQRLLEWLMVELVQTHDSQEDTRRTVPLKELHDRQPEHKNALDQLIEQLVSQERLLTKDCNNNEQSTITVAHEVLIRDWQQLRTWLENNREIKSWRSRLEDSMSAWKNNVSGSLLREKRLAEAQHIIGRNPNSLLVGAEEKAFIAASQKGEKQRKRTKVQLVALIMVSLIIGIVVTTWQWREVSRQARIILAGKLASQAEFAIHTPEPGSRLNQGLLLAVQAFKLDSISSKTRSTLNNTIKHAGRKRQTWYVETRGAVAFSPDGKYIVSSNPDNTLQLWEVASGKAMGLPWQGHKGWVHSVAFSPDGKYVVSGSSDHTLRHWETATGKAIIVPWQGHKDLDIKVAFSSDGKYVVSGSGNSDNTLRLWEVASGKLIDMPWQGRHKDPIIEVAFSPNGKYVVSGSLDHTLQLWEVASGKAIGVPWQGHKGSVIAVAFSPDGKYVVSGSSDHTLQLWEVASGKAMGLPWQGHKGWVHSVAFSPDGKYVVSGSSDHTLQLWEVASGKAIGMPWQGHESRVTKIAFSPDGKYVVSSSWDETLILWNVIDGKMTDIRWQEDQNNLAVAAFSPDGKYVATGSQNGTLQILEMKSGKYIRTPCQGHTDSITLIASNSNNQYMVSSSDHTLKLWKVTNGKVVDVFWQEYEYAITAVALSPDGKYMISADLDNKLHLWKIKNDEIVGLLWQYSENNPDTNLDYITALAFSPDGKYAVSGSWGILRLWDIVSGKTVGLPWNCHKNVNSITSIAFSPDGKYVVSGSRDKTICLWDAANGKMIGSPWRGHNDWVNAVAFSPDGKYVVSGSKDRTIRLWNVASGQTLGEPWHGHEGMVNAVTFSPDGKTIVSTSEDNTLRFWDADPESWAKKACSIVNRNFSLTEWQRFIGDALPYEETCPDLPAPGQEGWVEPYTGG